LPKLRLNLEKKLLLQVNQIRFLTKKRLKQLENKSKKPKRKHKKTLNLLKMKKRQKLMLILKHFPKKLNVKNM
jgi:hypothetical protein